METTNRHRTRSRVRRLTAGERGGETRQRLLTAAIDIFGRLGYEGASTRTLAEAAGVNLAAIPYHFGGKEGLYLAAAAHIAERIGERMGPVAERVASRMAGTDGRAAQGSDRAACLRLLQQLLDRFAEVLVLEEDADRWARFIVREQMAPTRAFDVLYGRVMKHVLGLVTTLVGRLTGRPPDDRVTRLRALTVIGQLLLFRAARAAVLRQMDWKTIGPRELGAIRTVVRENVAAITSSYDVASA